MKNRNCYIIAGGGTGGHVYPGVAVARSLQKLDPQCHIVFVGTAAGLENKIVPKEGFVLELIKVGKLNYGGGFTAKILTLLTLPVAFYQSFALLRRLQPRVVLGVGGYASGPLVLMASLIGYVTAIWEANAHPGLTNRLLSRFVKKSYLAFAEAKNLLVTRKIDVVGLPVRAEIENPLPQVPSELFRILVFGGSQGARAINRAVVAAVERGGDWTQGVKLVHQTGVHDYHELKDRYRNYTSFVEVHEFLYDMNLQYANCDLVICRGGAGTVAELSASGKVAIVIPLPSAADNHQQKNAETLVKESAGAMLLQSELTAETLIEEIQRLRKNPELRAKFSENIKKLFIPRAADNIARDIVQGL